MALSVNPCQISLQTSTSKSDSPCFTQRIITQELCAKLYA